MNLTRTYDITVDGAVRRVVITRLDGDERTGRAYHVSVDGGPEQVVNATRPVPDVLALLIDRHSWEAGLTQTDEGWDVEVLGLRHAVSVVDPRRKALRMASGGEVSALRSPMPGRVSRVLVSLGDEVKKGQPLCVVEAMKMENELKAPKDGKVKKILVEAGSLVETKAVLVELE